MQITNKFTISIHLLVFVNYLKNKNVTSKDLAKSIGVDRVIVRDVMSKLRKAGIIITSKGKSGITLARDLNQITFFDVYEAIEGNNKKKLFHFHEHPNPQCDIGRNIHTALDPKLDLIQQNMENEMKKITVANVMNDISKEIQKQQ